MFLDTMLRYFILTDAPWEKCNQGITIVLIRLSIESYMMINMILMRR